MIGLFDSGLGGLTVLRRLRERLPQADVIYYADQANVPYGDKSSDELQGLLRANIAWLDEQGADAIVMACNTSCSIASLHGWPPSRARIFDLIEAAAEAIAEQRYERIAVVATAATVRAGAYGRAVAAKSASAQVFEIAAPALVPLIEAAQTQSEVMEAAVSAVCAQLPAELDALVYGCTHYPLVDDLFARHVGEEVARVDPAVAQAERVYRAAQNAEFANGSGATRYVTTGEPGSFFRSASSQRSGSDSRVKVRGSVPRG